MMLSIKPCITTNCVFHQVVAVESHEAAEDGLLSFKEGDVILVLSDSQEVSVC